MSTPQQKLDAILNAFKNEGLTVATKPVKKTITTIRKSTKARIEREIKAHTEDWSKEYVYKFCEILERQDEYYDVLVFFTYDGEFVAQMHVWDDDIKDLDSNDDGFSMKALRKIQELNLKTIEVLYGTK